MSVYPSVRPVLFSNDEKRHFLYSDDDESKSSRDSQGQYKNDIEMSVRRYPTLFWERKVEGNEQ